MDRLIKDIRKYAETGELPEIYNRLGVKFDPKIPDIAPVTDEEVIKFSRSEYGKIRHRSGNRAVCFLNGGKTPKKILANKIRNTSEYKLKVQELCELEKDYILFEGVLNEDSNAIESVRDRLSKQRKLLMEMKIEKQVESIIEDVFTGWYKDNSVYVFLEKHFDEIFEEVHTSLKEYFTQGIIYINESYDLCSYESKEVPLDEHNLKDFIEQINDDYWIDNLSEILSDDDCFESFLFDFVYKNSEEFRFFCDLNNDVMSEIYDDLFDSEYNYKVCDKIKEKYTPDYVLELLLHNPNYTEIINNSVEINKFLLKQIPNEYKDLYPLARKIKRHFILHIGPTNSGKTYEAIRALKKVGSGIYLAPLRLLAYEQYEGMNSDGYPCSIITGEERTLKTDASFISSTIEMVDIEHEYACAVIDEAQMIGDEFRGGSWTKAILGLCCKEIHVCASVNAEEVIKRLITECGDSYEVKYHERSTPLVVEKDSFSFPDDIKNGDALIVFSRRNVHWVAAKIQEQGKSCSIIYGSLPYNVRHEEARRFLNHETDVLVCTDAVGMGMNLPIRRVVFLETQKFDGYSRRSLNPEEFKQIAGRAGRKGVFKIGYISSCFNNSHISKELNRPDKVIENAYISFPETLINMKYSLSEIIRQWKSIGEKTGYYKADIKDKLALCIEAESFIESKEVLYKLINLPFDIKNNNLHYMWMEMVKNEASGKHRRFTLDDISILSGTDEEILGLLEESHKICDLCYAYADRFGIYEDIEIIQYNKQIISDRIIKILKTTNMRKRGCRECGKELPWNYPYPICSECHEKIHLNYYDHDMNLFNRINLNNLKNMYA